MVKEFTAKTVKCGIFLPKKKGQPESKAFYKNHTALCGFLYLKNLKTLKATQISNSKVDILY